MSQPFQERNFTANNFCTKKLGTIPESYSHLPKFPSMPKKRWFREIAKNEIIVHLPLYFVPNLDFKLLLVLRLKILASVCTIVKGRHNFKGDICILDCLIVVESSKIFCTSQFVLL